jgi:hypothetical protein
LTPTRFREHLPWSLGGHDHRKPSPGSTACSSRPGAKPSWWHDRWAGNKMVLTEPHTEHRIGAARPTGHHARSPDRSVGIPPALLPAGQPGESNQRSSRRPARCMAMHCRPHRERARRPCAPQHTSDQLGSPGHADAMQHGAAFPGYPLSRSRPPRLGRPYRPSLRDGFANSTSTRQDSAPARKDEGRHGAQQDGSRLSDLCVRCVMAMLRSGR